MSLSVNCVFILILVISMLCETECRRGKYKDVKERDAKMLDAGSVICPTCDKLFCTVRKANKLKCKGGKTTDICGCCPVCAKQIGEPCGGEWNYLGKCDVGLYCKAATLSLLPPSMFHQQIKNEVPKRGMAEGNCVKSKFEKTPDIQDDEKSEKTEVQSPRDGGYTRPICEPKCTPDYCLRNPRSICSAVDVVDMKRDCHGSCQHTSCQACSWVDPDPDCGACSSDDFSCIKRFAKCIKRSYCTRSKFPCKAIAEKDHVGKFQCMVPKCLDKS